MLDLDPRNGSGESVRRLGDLPRTPTVLTGGGGTHYYFAAPEGACASRCGILPGIDLKGDGGYVVAPPSLHKSGEVYTWHVSLEDARPAFMPSSLRALIEQRRPPLRANGVVHEGGRNDFLFRSGCSLINRCEDPGAIIQELARLNQDQCQPPLPRQEVASIVASVSRYVQPPAGSGAPAGLLRALAGVQLTDDVVGQLVFEIHGCDLRYCGDRERWLVWNGKRWDLDYGNEAERRATRTVQCLRELLAGAESTVADPDAAQAGPDAGPMDGGLS